MPARPLYFVNWWCDGLVVGGLSIITWIILRGCYGTADSEQVQGVALALSLLVNFPHFSATIYRLYQKPENIRQFPVTAWGVPFVIAAAVCACFWQPHVAAPYFLMLFMIWSPYHFSGQTIGITMVYARRAGFPIGRRERLALSAFVFSAFACAILHAQQTASDGTVGFFDMRVPVFATPPWMYAAAASVMWTAALVFGGFALSWCIRERRILPPIVLLPAAAHFTWFVVGGDIKTFATVVPFFHSLQYLLIALAMQLKLRIDGEGGERSWRRVRAEALRWWSRNLAGGALLFIALPAALFWVPLPLWSTVGILAAAVNIHHFFVDGVIWKLRDPLTSAALSTSFAELGGAPAAVPALSRS